MKLPLGKTVVSQEGLTQIIKALREAGYRYDEDVELSSYLCYYDLLRKKTFGCDIKEKK
jgi:hypothetical protein